MSMGVTLQLHLHAAQRVPGPNPHHVSGRAYLHQAKRLRGRIKDADELGWRGRSPA